MAYTLISTQTLIAPQGGVTFSNIPSTFKDLVLEETITFVNNGDQSIMSVNGVGGTSYSSTNLIGNGSTASSLRFSNVSGVGSQPGSSSSTASPVVVVRHFMQYANTNVNKTVLQRYGSSSGDVYATVSLYRSTSAITSISVVSGNYAAGSTFKLWGIS